MQATDFKNLLRLNAATTARRPAAALAPAKPVRLHTTKIKNYPKREKKIKKGSCVMENLCHIMNSSKPIHEEQMNFDDLIRFKALNFRYTYENQGLIDMAVEGQLEHNIPMKNVCAMITQQLFDDLSNVCGLLDISKRAFIEAALIEALQKAHQVMEQEGVERLLEQHTVEA
jgi:hypothetical protein